MGVPKRARPPAEQAVFDEAAELRRAFTVIRKVENRITQLMVDARIPAAHCSVYDSGPGIQLVSLNAGRRVFLHPTGKRLYESTVARLDRVAEVIAEVGEWLKTQK